MTAAQEMNANGSSTSKDDVKQTNLLEKEPDRGKRDPRLGILLIDHGSKRKASNEHLNSIAEQYHSSLLSDDNDEKNNIVVKAAHMEIAEPSILTTLRQLIPGKHAMIDVPNLIAEAIQILGEERMLEYDGGVVEITSSKALGTNVKSMLGVVMLWWRNLDKEGGIQDDDQSGAVLEDVVQKLQSKLKTEQENLIEQQLTEKEEMNAQMANLTKKCHNATVAKLQETIVSLENEIQLRIEEADKQKQSLAEMSSKEEEETKEKSQQQEEKVRQLQTQLADLLDAYNELEQLQADTEAVVVDYKDQLKKTREMFDSELTVEKEKKEDYKVKWNELQLQLERKEMTEYESLLKAERDVSDVWKDKWEVLSKEQAINTTDATTSADMAEKSDAEKEEQQKQLQQYLQAELQTYYKTIQNQTAQLDGYEIELAEIETKHKESMLIATNSVEASQKRELDMLNTIEELEKEAAQTVPPPMPISDEVEDVPVEDSAEASKEDLTKIVEQLQSQVQALASEMKAASVDKQSKEDQNDVTGNEAQVPSSRSKRWRRRILRPWTMFRRNV
ncbi:sirohydrochlorin ferrochelatase [Skeletonema marinoi]|uniref:Sirohydrochlorin ferrochelatase n=1 Tax=Skeletonema marinoi TaxID=267567 RepID=A0AAD8YKP3_9STRA|nr:sirohydrochlorin ferrochelatase [Skeletonema marinoi]